MATESKSLVMTFNTAGGKRASMSIADPKEDLTEDMVRSAMTNMVNQRIFTAKSGLFTGIHAAQLVQRTATELFKEE